jgi:prepilin-type N-terminal cleavage/methylation domain-containing protein
MPATKGFSLIELLIALCIALILSAMMFQLFQQNERVIRDQTIVMEMQQTARIVMAQIADEVRMAGQGVPVYQSTLDTNLSEANAVFLATSSSSRIDFRAGLSNIATSVTTPPPLDFTIGISRALSVMDGSGFPNGKFVFVSGEFAWSRCALFAASPASLIVTPRETGTTDNVVRFNSKPSVSLDEAISIYLNAGSVRRATSADMTNSANPTWSAANEIGKNVAALNFTYFDQHGQQILPSSLQNRLSIARVDIRVAVQAASTLSDGTRPSYSLALRTIPRNVRIRWP